MSENTDRPDVVVDLEKELLFWAMEDPTEEHAVDQMSSQVLEKKIQYCRGAYGATRESLKAAYRTHNLAACHEVLMNDTLHPPWLADAYELLTEKKRREKSELYAWIVERDNGTLVYQRYPPHEFVEQIDEEDVHIVTWGVK